GGGGGRGQLGGGGGGGGSAYIDQSCILERPCPFISCSQVEISQGRSGEAFESAGPPFHPPDAHQQDNLLLPSSSGTRAGALPNRQFSYTLIGLEPASEYSVRVRLVTKSGPGIYSSLLLVKTLSSPTNTWKQVGLNQEQNVD
ncbi:unnamed protein product, partial [Choristocarpus tenellus]